MPSAAALAQAALKYTPASNSSIKPRSRNGAIATLPDKFLRNHATTMRLPRRINALFPITPSTPHPNTVASCIFTKS